MAYWAEPPERREQLVLFQRRLDEALPPEHPARALDEILGRLDWSAWEARYHGRLGQPPIHPRVLAGVLLLGMWSRLRSSRALEEALEMRLDFRWLAEGRSIDHSTINAFRGANAPALKALFTDVVQLARQLGLTAFEELGYDGTRVRANNRPRRSRTVEQLRQERDELAAVFEAWQARAEAEDAADQERFGLRSPRELPAELRSKARRLEQLDRALADLDAAKADGGTLPGRVPSVDLDARIMPNKEGNFAANYTPTALVDTRTGLIVGADVLSEMSEAPHLLPALDEAVAALGIDGPVTVLADGLMSTGSNLAGCEARGVTLYSPVKDAASADNPADRPDPTAPVAEADWPRLPTTKPDGKHDQLDKAAFVYDEQRDCYWCPAGKPLAAKQRSSEVRGGVRRETVRYHASGADCRECPLKSLCLRGRANHRQLRRDSFDDARRRQARRMATPGAKAIYARRAAPVERVFAIVKQRYGLRQFLSRGRQRVQNEWRWATTAYNLARLLSLLATRAGPGLAAQRPSPA